MLKNCSRLFGTRCRMSRGALIVLEGCDRCGKTTQCKKLVSALNADGIPAEMIVFPERTTAIGQMINDYLSRKCELEDHAVHLLFAANRWELVPRMKKALASGTTLIVDRYSFSGVAFSAAKPTLDLSWCRQPEVGLLSPDAVLYLTLSTEEAAKRSQFGGERYEVTSFQKQVAQNYAKLQEDNWKEIDASKSIEDLHDDIKSVVKDVISASKDKEIGKLWCTDSDSSEVSTIGISAEHEAVVSTNGVSDEHQAKKIKTDDDPCLKEN